MHDPIAGVCLLGEGLGRAGSWGPVAGGAGGGACDASCVRVYLYVCVDGGEKLSPSPLCKYKTHVDYGSDTGHGTEKRDGRREHARDEITRRAPGIADPAVR